MRKVIFLIFCVCGIASTAYAAGAAKTIGTYGAWTGFVLTEKNQKTCYMIARAQTKTPKGAKPRKAWITITQRPFENSLDVFSYNAGYNFKTDSDVTAQIGRTTFNLFTQKDTAWSRDARTDHQITAAIRRSAMLTITGVPMGKGDTMTEKINLKGADIAYGAISKACGVRVEEDHKKLSKPKVTLKKNKKR
jgi:hypothetical protein